MGYCYVGMMTHWGSYYCTGFTFLTETGKRKNNFFFFFFNLFVEDTSLIIHMHYSSKY